MPNRAPQSLRTPSQFSGYWEDWAPEIRAGVENHEARFRAMLADAKNRSLRQAFDRFQTTLRRNLNQDINADEAITLLSQHRIAKTVCDAYGVVQQNPVAESMQKHSDELQKCGWHGAIQELEDLEADLSQQSAVDPATKSGIVELLHHRFFRLAQPQTAPRLDRIHTPVEIVDYLLHSIEELLNREFGVSISDPDIHLLDPNARGGAFITRLLRSGLIRRSDLDRKYEGELHASEPNLLAYYSTTANIESTWRELSGAAAYRPYAGIALTDVFENEPMPQAPAGRRFARNNARIEQQKELDLRVILGNPPRHNVNDYVQTIQWAADRIQRNEKGGIIAYVTKNAFIDSNARANFRRELAQGFHAIYCYNLRGNRQVKGEKAKREGSSILGAGNRAGTAILLLVKKPGPAPAAGAQIHYRDIGEYLNQNAKLGIIKDSSWQDTDWQTAESNQRSKLGHWQFDRPPAPAASSVPTASPPEKLSVLIQLAIKDARTVDRATGHPNAPTGLAGALRAGTLGLTKTPAAAPPSCWEPSLIALQELSAGDLPATLRQFYGKLPDRFDAARYLQSTNDDYADGPEFDRHLRSLEPIIAQLTQDGF